MKEMKTLTINGETFQVVDEKAQNRLAALEESSGGGATIDDSVVSTEKTWSSKKIAQEIAGAGGEYELIETITVTEPMSIQRSQEPNGTTYKFRGLRVFVKSNANEQANLNFYLYNSKKSGYAQGTLGSISAGNTVTKYAYVQMENDHGLWEDSWFTFGDNIGASAKFANSYRTLALNTDFSKYDYVASILSSTAVAAGTTIEIWGWRL